MNNCKKECHLLNASLIPLTQGRFAIVDSDMLPAVSAHTWYCAVIRGGDKAVSHIDGTNQYMHRFILGCVSGDGKYVDHINHNTLDNRRCNLRACTNRQNAWNRVCQKNTTSRYKGVNKRIRSPFNWQAQIQVNGKKEHLGYFDNEDDAAMAYNKRAIEAFGDFANINEVMSR